MAHCFVRGDQSLRNDFLNDCTKAREQAQSLVLNNLGRVQTGEPDSRRICSESRPSFDDSDALPDIAPLLWDVWTGPVTMISTVAQPVEPMKPEDVGSAFVPMERRLPGHCAASFDDPLQSPIAGLSTVAAAHDRQTRHQPAAQPELAIEHGEPPCHDDTAPPCARPPLRTVRSTWPELTRGAAPASAH